jgi:hypothetical protein
METMKLFKSKTREDLRRAVMGEVIKRMESALADARKREPDDPFLWHDRGRFQAYNEMFEVVSAEVLR